MAANGDGEALTAGHPRTEPEEPVQDAEHDANLLPPSANGAQPAGRADAAPLGTPAHHADASAPGKAPPWGPAETRAKFEAQKTTPATPQRPADRETLTSGHNRDEDSFDAFMESCRSDPHSDPASAAPRVRPVPRRDYTEGTPLTASRQAHIQRNDTILGKTEHATGADGGPATASGAADQAPGERGAPGSGTRVEAGTNAASKPTGQPPGTAPPWGRGHLDYARLESDARQPSNHAEQAADQDPGLWIDWLTTEEQLALAFRIRWLLTSRSRHLAEGTRTMADITFGHRTGHTPPATTDHPGQWHYVATRLMAHMGAYSLDEMNELHWQWHQRAALWIRTAMQRHNVCNIPGSPGYQGHASGHRRPRSKEVPEPPRQAARRNSPERHQGPPPGVGSPSGTYRSSLRPFAPRRGQGSPHTSGVQGGTPERHQETRNPGRSRRRSSTPPPAARRVVFYNDTDRGHGSPSNLHAERTSFTTDPDTGPRGPAPNGRTSPPFPRQPSESTRQRFTQTPAGQQTERPAHPPPPPQCRRPAHCQGTARHGHTAKGTRGRPKACTRGGRTTPPTSPPRGRGAMTPVPDAGTGHPTN